MIQLTRDRVFILFAIIAAILLFIWLATHQYLAIDDFYFADQVRKLGVWKAMLFERNTWNSRWTSLLLNHSLLWSYLNASQSILIGYSLFNGWLLHLLAKQLLSAFNIQSNTLSFYVTALLFLGTFQIGEVWFWLASSTTYLTSTLLLALLFLKIRASELTNNTGLAFILPSIYIGGCSLPIALIAIYLLLNTLIKNLKREKPINIQWSILYLILVLLSLLLLLNGKGSSNRMMHFEHINVFDAFLLNFKLTALDILHYLLPILPKLLLLGLPLVFVQFEGEAISSRKLTAEIIFISINLLGILFLYQLIITYITQDIGAARTLFPINLILLFGYLKILYFINLYLKGITLNKYISTAAAMIAFITIGYITVKQFSIISTYSEGLQSRTMLLEQNTNEPIVLDSLPPSGFLYSSEISVDTTHFSNQHLKLFYQLKYSPTLNNH